MKSHLELKEFFVEGHEHDTSHVILNITEPSNDDTTKGHFFALAEVKNGSRDEIIELEKIFDDLEKSYYNTQNTTEKNSLELSLEFINRRAQEVMGNSEAEVDCIVGILENFHLIFSTHGSPRGILFYTKNGTLEHISIVDTEEHPKHFFSSLTEGDLHPGDTLLIATPQSTEFFSPERLEKLILTRSTEESAEHIQKVLKQLRSGLSYGGVIFHSTAKQPEAPIVKKNKPDQGSVASIDSLLKKEKNTAATLSPPLFHETREKVKSFFESEEQEDDTKPKTGIHQTPHHKDAPLEKNSPDHEPVKNQQKTDIILSFGKILVLGIKGILFFFIAIFQFFKSIFYGIFLLITNRHGGREHVLRNIRLSLQSKKEYIRHLPLLSKILLSVVVLSFCVFLGSVSYLKMHKLQTAQNEQNNNLLTAIEDKKNAAEASLLYNDTDRALSLIGEAQTYIAELPQKTDEEKQKVEALQKEISETLSKLQKTTVVNSELLADLSTKNPGANVNKMIKLNNALIINGVNDNNLYTVALDTKEITVQLHDTIAALGVSTAPKELDKIVFVSGENALAEFDTKTKSLIQKDIAFPVPSGKLISLAMYNRKLYTLDVTNNQIFKHSETLTGYDKGLAWITEPSFDIKNAVSIAIDGDMFVLKADGSILKFTSGKLVPFVLSTLLPPLTNPNLLWTSSDATHVYILETTQKRIILTDKNGKFEKQFTSPEWIAPSSFVVDEKGKKIYVLDGTKIYTFGM